MQSRRTPCVAALGVQCGDMHRPRSPLRRNVFELVSVGWVHLRAQRREEHELADAAPEAGIMKQAMVSTLQDARREWTYPARNALKGKFVTSTQYTNCMIPETIRNTRNASMSLRRDEVVSLYAFQSDSTALAVALGASAGVGAAALVVAAADFGGAMAFPLGELKKAWGTVYV